jgi:hypothetical protein
MIEKCGYGPQLVSWLEEICKVPAGVTKEISEAIDKFKIVQHPQYRSYFERMYRKGKG